MRLAELQRQAMNWAAIVNTISAVVNFSLGASHAEAGRMEPALVSGALGTVSLLTLASMAIARHAAEAQP